MGITLYGGLAEIKWLKSVAQPLCFAFAVAFLWQGDVWMRWLVGTMCIFSGGLLAFVCARVLIKLAGVTPPQMTGFFIHVVAYPVGIVGEFGLFYVLAGDVVSCAHQVCGPFSAISGEGSQVLIRIVELDQTAEASVAADRDT